MENKEFEDQLNRIESKLDKILQNQEWEKKQWKEKFSESAKAKQWVGFYLTSLLADETLGLNGTNSIFGNNK